VLLLGRQGQGGTVHHDCCAAAHTPTGEGEVILEVMFLWISSNSSTGGQGVWVGEEVRTLKGLVWRGCEGFNPK
jgi:hypothetical protein